MLTYKKGLKSLKGYIESEKNFCEDPRLNHGDQFRINQKRDNIRVLEDILRDFEMEGLELKVAFYGPTAPDLPHITKEKFQEKGIELQYRGMMLTASLESAQSEFAAFVVNISISIASGIIGSFLYDKLKRYKNTKMKIGKHELKLPFTLEDIRKIIREELERVKKEKEEQ